MPDAPDLHAVLSELTATRAALTDTVTKMRRRHHAFVILSVATTLFLIGYLGYASYRFGGDLTPELVAANVQSAFKDSLPGARAKLEQTLRQKAPTVVDNTFDQLQALPARYSDSLQAEATARMDAAMPAVQEQMYTSMKTALDQAAAQTKAGGGSGQTDEARLQTTLRSVSDVYATETMRFVEQGHNTYAADATTFTDYLERLATSPNLDHRDQLHREMFRTIFALVRQRAAASPAHGDGDLLPMAPAK